jgi:hypothetical protein
LFVGFALSFGGGLFVLLLVGLVVSICVVNTLRVRSMQFTAAEVAKLHSGALCVHAACLNVLPAERDRAAYDRIVQRTDEMAERLGAAIRFPTISLDKSEENDAEAKFDDSAILGLHKFLIAEFPLVHKHLKRTVVNKYSLVYEWCAIGVVLSSPASLALLAGKGPSLTKSPTC